MGRGDVNANAQQMLTYAADNEAVPANMGKTLQHNLELFAVAKGAFKRSHSG
ncbi:MAG: hypothetical protein WAO12_01310 [Venatoribacter sp.]